MATLANKRPGMKYIWVNTNDTLFGVDYYLSLGAVVVQQSEDGPRQAGTRGVNPFRKTDGPNASYIMFQGNVLMEMPQEIADEIEMNGPDGCSGQLDADRIAQQLSGRSIAQRLQKGFEIGREGRPIIGFVDKASAGFDMEPAETGV